MASCAFLSPNRSNIFSHFSFCDSVLLLLTHLPFTDPRPLTFAQVAANVDAYVTWRYGGAEFGGWYGKWAGHSIGSIGLGLVVWFA